MGCVGQLRPGKAAVTNRPLISAAENHQGLFPTHTTCLSCVPGAHLGTLTDRITTVSNVLVAMPVDKETVGGARGGGAGGNLGLGIKCSIHPGSEVNEFFRKRRGRSESQG